MEEDKIKFGLSQHFPKHQWRKDLEYLKTCLQTMHHDLDLHAPTAKSAFLNIIGYLKSINERDIDDCEEIYERILETEPSNINALIGLSECTSSTTQRDKCKTTINEIICSEKQRKAVPKALLEIGLALCLLIPGYTSEEVSPATLNKSNDEHDLDSSLTFNEKLEFVTEKPPMNIDPFTNSYIAQKKRVYNSLRYFQEGLFRFSEVKTDQDKSDENVWLFFLGMTYNSLDSWVAYTHDSYELRKQFSLKSLELFCELAVVLNPNSGEKHSKMYFQRCLSYIGQILVSRKDVIMHGEEEDYVPECFLQYEGHFLRGLWDDPNKSFTRALEYGYDPVVYAKHAKCLLYEKKYDTVIEIITDIFSRDGSINWYPACIRMRAYKLKHMECYRNAKQAKNFSTLTKEYLLKAEQDGKYCFDTYARASDLAKYAVILRWLGTFPDGESVTDPKKLRSALNVLVRVYKEQGCHTHFKIHKTRAECHANLGEIDEAIKYAIWSHNSSPKSLQTPPISLFLLTDLLFTKLNQQQSKDSKAKQNILMQIKYYTESEIKRCNNLLKTNSTELTDNRIRKVKFLLEKFDHKLLNEITNVVNSDSILDRKQKEIVSQFCNRYNELFSLIRNCCRKYPDLVKCLLTFICETEPSSALPTIATMCLICLGKTHTAWTQEYNRTWKERPENENTVGLCSLSLENPPNASHYDFLLIHAPEDKEWVFYTFLPEMEDRPKQFRGNVTKYALTIIVILHSSKIGLLRKGHKNPTSQPSQKSKEKSPGSATITNRSPSQTQRGKGNRQTKQAQIEQTSEKN